MPANRKPRRAYRPRGQSIYPDLHDVGLIFRPIYRLFDQLRAGEVDSRRGAPVFRDWQGDWCEVVPALEGWVSCWQRVADGENITVGLSAIRKLAKRLQYDVPMTGADVEAAWREVLATQRLTLRIPRATMCEYMRVEQIKIELDRIGVTHAAA